MHDINNNDSTLLVAKLAQLLEVQGKRVTVAESCTGGLLAAALTALPGSSAWFEFGFVTYSNRAKQQLLGVPGEIFDREGAVSAACVTAMVEGALARSGADLGVAISGIAGPDGGSVTKPVGTVWLGWGRAGKKPDTCCLLLSGSRAEIREQAVNQVLIRLLQTLEK